MIPQNKSLRNSLMMKENFSDSELMEILESNNLPITFKNVQLLKEAKKALVNEEVPEDESAEEEAQKEQLPPEAEQEDTTIEEVPRVSISIPADGSMSVETSGKSINVDPANNAQISLAEKLSEKRVNYILESFLTEDCEMSLNEYQNLTEETKIESLKDIVSTLLKSVEEKLASIDTTVADRSRGDIHNLKELPAIQDAITKLETIIERSDEIIPAYATAVNTIIKSIYSLNTYSNVFKDAYRNKKTVMIMRYQSVILGIISSISYLISSIVSFGKNGVNLKNDVDIDNFAPLQSLNSFVKSVESGEFKMLVKDNEIVREYFLEIPVEKMNAILEAPEYGSMIVDGIRSIFNAINGGNARLNNILYKAAGYIVLLFSIRETFYSIFRMKTKVSDMMNGIQQFVNVNSGNGSIIGKLAQFANKFRMDGEQASDISKREMEDENKKLLNDVRDIQAQPRNYTNELISEPEQPISQPSSNTSDTFAFDF